MKNKDLGFRQFLPVIIVGVVGLIVWVAHSNPNGGPPLGLCSSLVVALVVAIIAGLLIGSGRRKGIH